MIKSFFDERYGRQSVFLGGLAFTIYLVMILITLAQIEKMSGFIAFDMRPGGYTVSQAKALLKALGQDGRLYYLTRQLPLDLLYPALMALTLISTLLWLATKNASGWLVKTGKWLSIAAAVADYLENVGIVLMLENAPNPPAMLIHTASFSSVTKAGLTSIAFVVLILCAVQVLYRKFKV